MTTTETSEKTLPPDVRRERALRALFDAIRRAIPDVGARAPVMAAAIAYGTAEQEVSRG